MRDIRNRPCTNGGFHILVGVPLRDALFFLLFAFSALFLSGCGADTANTKEMKIVTDGVGRRVSIPDRVERVVVTNAYTVELINAIDRIDRVVGVDYRIYSDKEGFGNRFTADMVIGQSQGALDYEKVIALSPDILFASGTKGGADAFQERLNPFGISVVVMNSYYTEEFESNVTLLGEIFDNSAGAERLKSYFVGRLNYVNERLRDKPKKTAYFEYRKAGQTTVKGDYFYEMVEIAGADNIYADAPSRQISVEDVVSKNPGYIVKVSEADVLSTYVPPSQATYDRIRENIVSRPGWDEIDAVKNNRILLMSHYVHGGASKLVGAMYVAKFLYPEYLPELNPEEVFRTWVTEFQHIPYKKGHTYPAFEAEDGS